MKVEEIIKAAIKNAMSYQEYRNLVATHTENQTNTGEEITEALANYTMLNNQRMKRLDKTMKLLPQTQEFLESYTRDIYFLIITESWCGDAAQTMPMINKIAQTAQIELKVVLRDQNPVLMDQFLTNGSRSIAKLIMVDATTHTPIANWGPRPTQATQLVQQEKAVKGFLSPEFKQELQNWYNKDKGKNTENDIVSMLEENYNNVVNNLRKTE